MKRDAEKTKRRNAVVVGLILVGLMIVSTAGYSLMGNEDEDSSTKEYRGLEFVRQNGLWRTVISNQVFGFQYLPEEVGNVSVLGTYDINSYVGKPLYFVKPDAATSEILNNLGDYVLRWQEACIEGIECGGDYPVKNCSDNVIVFEFPENNETEVYKQESCVYISGDSVRGADAFLYKVLKIS